MGFPTARGKTLGGIAEGTGKLGAWKQGLERDRNSTAPTLAGYYAGQDGVYFVEKDNAASKQSFCFTDSSYNSPALTSWRKNRKRKTHSTRRRRKVDKHTPRSHLARSGKSFHRRSADEQRLPCTLCSRPLRYYGQYM